jgi:thiol-disulfide isomerase/thioredoxin
MVKEFALYEDLQEIVQLAKQSMPERPDGILTVVKFTSASDPNCRATEAEYERLARANPATIFLRCFQEYDNASLLMGQANVQTWPTYDLFYGGNRVARLEGGSLPELEELLDYYQFQNSELDLFSEQADNKKRLAWQDGKVRKDPTKTPRTTGRFIPGYDWDKDRGFFDDLGDKFQEDWDTIYGNWVPNVDEDK